MLKRQRKIQKIKKMLKNVNIHQLKIIDLKNTSKKTHFKRSQNILFVNPQVKKLVLQILQNKFVK